MKKILIPVFLFATLLFGTNGTTYHYDPAGRLSQVVYASGKTVEYRYDAHSNLLSRKVYTLCYDPKLLREQFATWPQQATVNHMIQTLSCTGSDR